MKTSYKSETVLVLQKWYYFDNTSKTKLDLHGNAKVKASLKGLCGSRKVKDRLNRTTKNDTFTQTFFEGLYENKNLVGLKMTKYECAVSYIEGEFHPH